MLTQKHEQLYNLNLQDGEWWSCFKREQKTEDGEGEKRGNYK